MKTLQSEQGFTLIEVLTAVVILSVGILSLNSMQIFAIRGNSTANNISGASNSASDRIEQIFSMPYNNLVDNPSVKDGLAGLDNNTSVTADYTDPNPPAGYRIYWNVAEDEPMTETKTIRVIVQRTERGLTKQIAYDYIKAKVVNR